jgi:hypothetical protein
MAMFLRFLFTLTSLLVPFLNFASGPGDCDTLYTRDGDKFAVQIIRKTYTDTEFMLCNDISGTVYRLPQSRLLALRKAGDKRLVYGFKGDDSLSTKVPDKYLQMLCDTCDFIVLDNGEEKFVRLVDQDMFNYYYLDCPFQTDRVYILPESRVQSLRRRRIKSKGETASFEDPKDDTIWWLLGGCLGVLVVAGILFLVTLFSLT